MKAKEIPGISQDNDWGTGIIEKGLRGGRAHKPTCERALIIAEKLIDNPSLLEIAWKTAKVHGSAKMSIAALALWLARGWEVYDTKDGVKCGGAGRKIILNANELSVLLSEIETEIDQRRDEKMAELHDDPAKIQLKMEHIYDYYEDKGFFFSKEILTRYFLSLKTKPFVILTGISGTGKTKIAQIFADYICQDDTPEERSKRIAFVPVKPDWMDSKGLLGYYNLLDERYHVTPVLCLLLEAKDHPDKPYFIILDEMNLAKVEHYFSDFLSIMESRTQDKPEGEALHLHSRDNVQAQDGKGDVPTSFNIPANVYFTGTVNIDESTYMFSSKVLDRANVIEFNDVELTGYKRGIGVADSFVLSAEDARNKLQSGDFTSKANFDAAVKTAPTLYTYLDELLFILRQYHLHFGYRVINEISHFVCNAQEMIRDFDLEETMDIQILQKILPKFHGTQGKLEKPLNEMFEFCSVENARFPRSAQKLERMIQNLQVQGYTSFIE
jgi:energy-coupling factor transporter ATP-binding protein EcfA2